MSNEHLLFNTGPVKSSSSSFFFCLVVVHISSSIKPPRSPANDPSICGEEDSEAPSRARAHKRFDKTVWNWEFGASCWFKVCYTRWGTGRNLGTILKHRKTWRRCPNYDPLPCRRTSVLVRVQHQPVVCNANDAFVGGSDTMLLMLLQSIQFSA